MRKSGSALVVAGALMACTCLQAAETPAAKSKDLIPLELFAQDAEVSAPSMSPDGKSLVYITHVGDKAVVMLAELGSQKPSRPLLNGETGTFTVHWCAFKNDERILCSFRGLEHEAGRPYGLSRLVALNTDGKKMKVLMQRSDASTAQFQDRILHWLPDDKENVIIQVDEGNDGDIYPSVFRLNIYTGNMGLVQSQRTPVVTWMTDRTGTVRFGYGFRSQETSGIYLARSAAGQPWQIIEKFHRYDDQRFYPLGFSALPNTLLVSAPNGDKQAVWEFDLSSDREVQLLFANAEADVSDTINAAWDGHLLGFQYETDRPHSFYIDDLAKSVDAAMKKYMPDRFPSIIGGSRNSRKMLLSAYSDVKPAGYYALDLDTGTLQVIGYHSAALEKATLAPMKTISVPVGDMKIPGYLTVPVGKEPKNLPLVVYPHGGPYARDTWGYDPVVQMMASRGYAVLQLNFRGSTGLGQQWFDAGWRGWGGVIHDDITAGAKWAISQGIADPKRMCIVGWSYGGYAALLGVVREPELYRCAASIAGVSDLNALKYQESFFYGGAVAARESIGSDKKALRNDSPLDNAANIKVPVLLVHGEDDFTVLVSHSKNMAKELKKHNVPTELVLIPDGQHDLARESMRLTLFQKLEAFLAANLGAP